MDKILLIKRNLAEIWAWDDVNDYNAKDWIADLVADYYEDSLPNTREELKEYLIEQKSYDEDDAEELIKDLEGEV
jgi:hypothetical protein|tara:strand:+ start:1603 stop:1827 length:225 start_codon:yes stop_codon:yes gene_type:complete